MISYQFRYENAMIKSIEIKGHASSDYGNDIVCASISTAIIVTLNAINKLKLEESISFKLDEGLLDLTVKVFNETVNALLENLQYTLHELKEQYPKKIINYKE
ncbi:ribosomal-processing cysteine protease Prp [Acholeplasma sp. OttesenSCG-928-E16]|nr:ribosomal-processing cysteine protease Prp [Acholeplasma sp. OttesenSCG-928-E16]